MNTFASEIKQLVIRAFKSDYGKGPESVRVSISDNIILIDIRGSLSPLETALLRKVPESSKKIIKSLRKQLLDSDLDYYTAEARRITNIKDLKLETYTFEIDFHHDRQIMIFICNKSLDHTGEVNREIF